MESVAILSHSFINSKNSIVPCRTAIVDLGLNEVDPGLAPDGAKCGENKVSINCEHNIDNCAFYVNGIPIILSKFLFFWICYRCATIRNVCPLRLWDTE